MPDRQSTRRRGGTSSRSSPLYRVRPIPECVMRCWVYPQELTVPASHHPHFANHHRSGVDPNAHGEADASLALKPYIQCPHRLQQAETVPHSPLGIVFMHLG